MKTIDELEKMLIELSWVLVDDRLPTKEDANKYGDVDWSDGDDIWEGAFDRGYDHATHWRKIVLPNVKDHSPIGAVGASNTESNSAAPIG
jgi:hypothetical protein